MILSRLPLALAATPTRLAAALSVILLAALPLAGPTVAADSGDITRVGTLPRFPADAVAIFGDSITPAFTGDPREANGGTLIGVPRARQLWQVFPVFQPSLKTLIAVRDMDSLKIVHTLEVPYPLSRGATGSTGGDWLHAVDGDRRLFLGATDPARRQIRVIVEIDLETFAQRFFTVGSPFSVPDASLDNQAFKIGALEYDPFDDALLLLLGTPSTVTAPVTFVHGIFLETGDQKTRQLRTCSGPLASLDGSTSQTAGIVTREHVYFSCQRQGNIGAVVKVKRSELFGSDPTGLATTSEEHIVAGPGYLETAFADPAAGRIFLVTLSGEIWAYDITTSSFVGVVAGGVEGQLQVNTGFGLDDLTGRLFLQSERLGLGIAEGRFYPIPQARTFPDFKAPGQERIISDGKNERIFVLTGTLQQRALAYQILDVGAAPAPPAPPDPDRNTVDIDPRPGVTDARYFASGTGFGVRTLLAKGVSAVPPAPAQGQNSPTAQTLQENINSKCGFSDREMSIGRVSKAEYDTGSTAAQAIGVDVDERTKLDLSNPSRCDVTATSGGQGFQGIFSTEPVGSHLRELEADEDSPARLEWTRKPAACSSSEGGERATATSENESNSKGYVECPLPGGKLVATSVGYLTGAVSVGRAETTTEVSRDGHSVVSVVTSEAHDIDLAGVIQIGRITATARSKANGRPQKDPMSEHVITVQGVRIAGTTVCTNNCDMDNVIRTLNTAAAGRVEFRSASGRDDGLLRGSPRGASTAVQKSLARQTSDQALTGDRSVEVTALEMTIYNDNPRFGRARQVFQFAGVATAATYNIALLPTGAGFDNRDFDDDIETAFEPGGTSMDDILPGVDVLPPTVVARVLSDDDEGGPIARVVQAVARGIRMFLTNPRHALLLITAWAMFGLPGVLSRRRRLLINARSE